MELLALNTPLRRVRLYGGGAKSRALCQIIADVCGFEILVPKDSEFLPARGVSICRICLSWLGKRLTRSMRRNITDVQIGARYSPNSAHAAVYEKGFERYKKIYPAVKDI